LDCFEDWIIDGAIGSIKALPSYVILGIWLTQNISIFEDKEENVERLVHQLRLSFGERRKSLKQARPRFLHAPYIDQSFLWGYFDGVCQGVPRRMWLESLTLFRLLTCFLFEVWCGVGNK
jgi:hypothetical protein